VGRRDLIDDELNDRMERVLGTVSLGRAAREKVQIKVRQPLGRMWVLSRDGGGPDLDDDLRGQIGQELNIKEVILGGNPEELVTQALKLNFAALGTKLGPAMKEVAKAAKDGAWTPQADGTLTIAGHILEAGEFELQYAGREGLSAAGDRELLVVIDTTVTEELLREGYAREIVRTVQDLRKQADYKVEDRITVLFHSEDARVQEVFRAFGGYIAEETLALELIGAEARDDQVDKAGILQIESGCAVWLGTRRR